MHIVFLLEETFVQKKDSLIIPYDFGYIGPIVNIYSHVCLYPISIRVSGYQSNISVLLIINDTHMTVWIKLIQLLLALHLVPGPEQALPPQLCEGGDHVRVPDLWPGVTLTVRHTSSTTAQH